MLKNASSLVLVLGLAVSVFAGTARIKNQHFCRMTEMEMMRGGHFVGMNPMTCMTMPIVVMQEIDMSEMDHEMDMSEMDHETDMSEIDMSEMDHQIDVSGSDPEQKISGMHDIDVGMETMSCCKDHVQTATKELCDMGACCVTIPQETGSTQTTCNLRSPTFSIAISHPAVLQALLSSPKLEKRPPGAQLYLPDLQASFVRNLAFLI